MFFKIKIWLICISLTAGFNVHAQGLFQTISAEVDFFSSAPVEDIQAGTNTGIAVFNLGTGEISFMVKIKSLNFPKALMQEHFNENYMESDKYPNATFKGRIVEPANLPVSGEVPVVLSGILKIHGVSKKREIPARLNISEDQIILTSKFNVACKDHEISIPKILWRNIAEVVEVRVNANMKQ